MAFAAPEAILSAVDLLAIAGVLLMLGLLFCAKGLVQVLFSPLDIGIYLVGHPFHGIVTRIENALLDWLDAQIASNQQALAELFSGLVWLVKQTANSIEETAHYAEQAFDYLTTTTIPREIDAAINDASAVAHGASTSVTALAHTVATDVRLLEGKITGAINTAEDYADARIHATEVRFLNTVADTAGSITHDLGATIHGVERTLGDRIDRIGGTIQDKANAARDAAIAAIQPKIDSALHAAGTIGGVTDAAVRDAIGVALAHALATGGTIENAIESAVNAANHAVTITGQDVTDAANNAAAASIAAALVAGGAIDREVQSVVQAAIAGIATTGGIALADVEGLLKPITQEIENLSHLSLPQLAAATAGIAATLSLVMVESGLDTPGCRAKNKGICGVDANAWSGLLAGVAVLGIGLDFEGLVDTSRELLNGLIEGGEAVGILPT